MPDDHEHTDCDHHPSEKAREIVQHCERAANELLISLTKNLVAPAHQHGAGKISVSVLKDDPRFVVVKYEIFNTRGPHRHEQHEIRAVAAEHDDKRVVFLESVTGLDAALIKGEYPPERTQKEVVDLIVQEARRYGLM